MKKRKIYCSTLISMISIALFAASSNGEQADLAEVQQTVNVSPSSPLSPLMIILYGLTIFVLLGIIAYITIIVCNKFLGHFKRLDSVEESLKTVSRSLGKYVASQSQQNNSGYTENDVAQIKKHIDGVGNTLYACLDDALKKSIEDVSSLLNSSTSAFSQCKTEATKICEEMNKIKTNLGNLNTTSAQIADLQKNMQTFINSNHELANLAVTNAVELIKQCNDAGFSTAKEIKEAHEIAQKFHELSFSSIEHMKECKAYYDKKNDHEKTQKELAEQKQQLETDLATERKEAKEKIKAYDQYLNTVCPQFFDADNLLVKLQGISPDLRAETLALIVQLYWFSQLFRNAPAKIKAAFARFDDTLYELFEEQQELLQDIRKFIRPVINDKVFKGTSYEITWPELYSLASGHEDEYNLENDEGNRICKVRSAVIRNAGNVESVARIYTSL